MYTQKTTHSNFGSVSYAWRFQSHGSTMGQSNYSGISSMLSIVDILSWMFSKNLNLDIPYMDNSHKKKQLTQTLVLWAMPDGSNHLVRSTNGQSNYSGISTMLSIVDILSWILWKKSNLDTPYMREFSNKKNNSLKLPICTTFHIKNNSLKLWFSELCLTVSIT